MNEYEYRNLDDRPKGIGFWPLLQLTIATFILFWLFVAGVMTAFGAPPDPWVRMTFPSGCSGGVFHASREYGIWIATCKHCVNRKGRVRLMFFQDGQRAKVDGQFVRSHPQHDCAIVWVSSDNFYELPQQAPLADSWYGPYKGQPVYLIGSYAGNTVHPAVRHVSIKSINRGAYQFNLNDDAWGGSSGGSVVDAATGRMLGVLWGSKGGTSFITSNKALLETVYGTELFKQGMYSVNDDVHAQQVARKPKIDVEANRKDIEDIRREVESSHYLNDHFDFDFDTDWFRSTPRIEWKINGKGTYSDGWHGVDGFIWQYRNSGGQFT